MFRSRSRDFDTWFTNPKRKPLIVRGARQVGKTWLIRDFARRHGLHLVEINFEQRPILASLFESNDPHEICRQIDATLRTNLLNSPSALLFLDEIQTVPEVIGKLRWFYEQLPMLPVIAAGSLLEFALINTNFSVPVGRVAYLYIEPMSFSEWLRGTGDEALADWLDAYTFAESPTAMVERLDEALAHYQRVGGMPEAVVAWAENRDFRAALEVQHNLIAAFRDDFHKYAGRHEPHFLDQMLSSVARQLGTKFVYSHVDNEIRTATAKVALDLLCTARLCHRILHTSGNGLPLAAETNDRRFKVVGLDIGLISGLLNFTAESAAQQSNKGSLAEQFVGQQLRTLEESFVEPSLHYWQREHGRVGEVDYLIPYAGKVLPVEVKSGSAGRMKSLQQFMGEKNLQLAVRFYSGDASLDKFQGKTTQGESIQFDVLSLPLWAAEYMYRALEHFNNVTA